MPDRAIVPLGALGVLDLPRTTFEQHLVKPGEAAPAPAAQSAAAELLDAKQLEAATGVAASWWMAQARERRVPHLKIGRYTRFDLAAIVACEALQRRVIAPGRVSSDAPAAVQASAGRSRGRSAAAERAAESA